MRNKKLVSTVVASALVATTMAMPVMAAEGGELPVVVQTKTAVIRVKVPTSMEIAVNQFELADAGSQIYSNAFTMENMSEIPVKVGVTSTVELKDTTKLLASKAAAGSSTKAGEAWLAVAAQTDDDDYTDGSTALADLAESNKNVKTFAQGTGADAVKGTAGQTFYLKESGTMAYKLLNTTEDPATIEYAQYYKLTPITLTASKEDAELTELIKSQDIYSATVGDGAVVTKTNKGTTAPTYATGTTYYTAAMSATAKDDIAAGRTDLYMYGDGTADAADGKAGFRYIGKLSGGQEDWSKEDITKVTIKYDIAGVEASKYSAIPAADLTYGLYVPSPVAVTGDKITNGGGNTVFDTSAKLATQLKGGYSVVFRVPSGTDLAGYEVTKIEVDDTEYQFTKGTAASTANSDGKAYTLKSFTAATADKVEVFYSNSATGESYIVTYTYTAAP